MKSARTRQKSCDACGQVSSVLYRVQRDQTGVWVFLCPACRAVAERENQFYVYGGTWKANKRH